MFVTRVTWFLDGFGFPFVDSRSFAGQGLCFCFAFGGWGNEFVESLFAAVGCFLSAGFFENLSWAAFGFFVCGCADACGSACAFVVWCKFFGWCASHVNNPICVARGLCGLVCLSCLSWVRAFRPCGRRMICVGRLFSVIWLLLWRTRAVLGFRLFGLCMMRVLWRSVRLWGFGLLCVATQVF